MKKELKTMGGYAIWQWIIVYLLIGALAYGGYYIYNSRKNAANPGKNTRQTRSNNVSSTPKKDEQIQIPSAKEAEGITVALTDTGFEPQTLTIKAGTEVSFVNQSGKKATVDSSPHPQHTDSPFLNLGSFDDSETLKATFETVGTFKYHNHLNPSQSGTVAVE